MGSITSVTANPTTIAPGGTAKIVPTIVVDQIADKTVTVTVELDGVKASAPVILHTPAEALTYSVNPADAAKSGVVVCTTDGGTVTSNGDGTFTLHV